MKNKFLNTYQKRICNNFEGKLFMKNWPKTILLPLRLCCLFKKLTQMCMLS